MIPYMDCSSMTIIGKPRASGDDPTPRKEPTMAAK